MSHFCTRYALRVISRPDTVLQRIIAVSWRRRRPERVNCLCRSASTVCAGLSCCRPGAHVGAAAGSVHEPGRRRRHLALPGLGAAPVRPGTPLPAAAREQAGTERHWVTCTDQTLETSNSPGIAGNNHYGINCRHLRFVAFTKDEMLLTKKTYLILQRHTKKKPSSYNIRELATA